MTNNLDWFRENFENIRINVDRMKYLEELQIAVSNLSHLDLASTVSHLQLGIIFDCFNTTDNNQLELAIAIAKKFLSALEPRDVIKLYGIPLGRALEHPDIEAKRLVLNELKRTVQCPDILAVICGELPLLQSVIECIKNENLSLASIAMEFFNELGKMDPGIQTLFSSPILDSLKNAASTNDTVRFRIYEVVVNISVHSVSGLTAAVQSNLLIDLLNELQSNDILLQLTSLETITKLALTDHGLQFLKSKDLLTYMSSQLTNTANIKKLLLPGYIKFFGNVAQVKPQEILCTYPSVMDVVFQLYTDDDPVISNVALETTGYIASSLVGKLELVKYDSQMKEAVSILGKMIVSETTERKVLALNVLANILHLEFKDQTQVSLNITKTWFSALSQDPMKMLKNVCEKPFKELKLAGLSVLQAIAEQPWGQEEINKCPGLIEYLFDRNEEGDMNCKVNKYNIVKTIFDSQSSRTVFPEETMNKFQVHVRQGVIYAQTKTEVTFENAP